MKPGNLVTNEVVKDPTTIDKDMDESDGDMGEDFNIYSWLPRTYIYLDPWYRPLPFNFAGFSYLQREEPGMKLQREKARLKQEEVIKMEEEENKKGLQLEKARLKLQREKARLKQEEMIKMELQREKARLKLQLEKARLKQEEMIKMELQLEKARLKQKELIQMKLQREKARLKLQLEKARLKLQLEKARLKQKELIQMKLQRQKARLKQKELIKMKEEVTKIRLQCEKARLMLQCKEPYMKISIPLQRESTRLTYEEMIKMKQEIMENLITIQLQCESTRLTYEEVIKMKQVVIKILPSWEMLLMQKEVIMMKQEGIINVQEGIQNLQEVIEKMTQEVIEKMMQEAFGMKERKNLFKVILTLLAYIVLLCSILSHVPDWCVVEMTYVETGNAPELHKCQTARKIRELLEHESPADREDILGMAGYPRQGESVPAQAVKTANRHQQSRQRKCPFNVPGYRPISAIKESDTARKIAEGCIAQSKNAGKYQSGNHQTMTKKRSATTTTVQPASKQPRTSAANTSTQPATSTIVRPNSASPAISIAICAQPVVNATASSKRLPATSTIVRPTTSTNSAVATACYTGSHSSTFCTSRASNNISTGTLPSTAQVSKHLNHDGQQSNDTSTGTHPNAAKNRQQPNRGGQPSNLISLPSDDLGDLGFSSNVDLDQFIKQIMKDGEM